MVEINLPEINLEHNKFIDRVPLFFIMGLLGLMLMPISPEIKSPIIIGGLIAVFPLLFAIDAIAQVEVAKNNVIKARIMPWKIEKEFHIQKTIGRINKDYNRATERYVTPFRLAFPVSIPELKIPKFEEFEIEHKLQWETRNKACKAFVHWQGIEVTCPNVYLCELWYTGERAIKVGDSKDYLGFVPRFRLGRGSEDFWLYRGEPIDENLIKEERQFV